MSESLSGDAGIVVEVLRFNKDIIFVFEPQGVKLGFLPSEIVDFSVKIEGEEAEIVASEVVFVSGVPEADNEIHEANYNWECRFRQ